MAHTTRGSQNRRAERDDVSRKHNFLILSELPGKIASFIGRNADSFRRFTADSSSRALLPLPIPLLFIYGYNNAKE